MFGQAASLEGRVEDQSGARIAGADITLVYKATGQQTQIKSREDGTFRFLKIVPGMAEVRVSYPGFTNAVRGVEVGTMS